MADEMDRAQRIIEQHDALALAAQLARREPPGDGICVSCGDDIAPERLAAEPGARRCVVCQNIAEERIAEGIRA